MDGFESGTNRLIGREAELATVRRFLDGAATDGATLLLTGDPGVGKSALLQATVEMAKESNFRVLRGSGVEYETDVSFAGLHQLVEPLSGDLGELPDSSRVALEVALAMGAGPAPDRLAVLSASLALFRRAATTRPLLLVVDDLHWLDRASGAAIGFVGRRLQGSRIGLIGALRPGVGGFFERAGLSEFDVAPLVDAQAMHLLNRRFPSLRIRTARRVVDDAQGNPLALLEFGASESGRRDGGTDGVSSGTSREVRTLYEARVEQLPPPTRRLLLLAALDGSGDLGVLAAASQPRGLDDLGPAERDNLIVVDDRVGELRFRHPMIKSAVVGRSTHDERRAAHHRLADQFSDQPERRAHHLGEAAHEPDEDIAAALENWADRTLRRGDVVSAISTLLRAADLSPNPSARGRRLADAAYLGARLAGELDSASELLRDAHRGDPSLADTLHAATATAYLLLNSDGMADTAAHLLVDAIESALDEPDQDRDGLSDALNTLLLVCHFAARADYWVSFHDAVRRLGSGLAPEVRLLAEVFADPVAASPGALAAMDDRLGRLCDIDDVELIVRTAIAGFYSDRLASCRDALWRVVQDGREGGAVGSGLMALSMLAFAGIGSGRWDEAQELADEAAALSEERGYGLIGHTINYARALIAGNRGDRQACLDICQAMIDWAAPRQVGGIRHFANHALAQAALGTGEFEEGYAHATAISPPGSLAPHIPQALWVALDVVDAAIHTGRDAEARAHAEAMTRAQLGRLSPRLALVTAAAQAMVAPDQQACGLFDAALTVPGIDEWPFELARVRLAYGERLRRLRRTRDARAQLVAARDGFEQLGAGCWERRASVELGATGETRHRGGGGVTSLTAHELEVAELAATGMSNRDIATKLFVSPRTVSAHLYRIFPKLGITTRAGLRDALNARSDDAPR